MIKLNSAASRIKYVRNLAGFDRKSFSGRFNISANTLQSWELGRAPLSPKGAQRLCSALLKSNIMCTTNWLISGSGERPFLYKTTNPILHTLCDESILLQEIDIFKSLHPNYLLTAVTDVGMNPFYDIGDYVGGKTINEEKNILEITGNNCIIKTSEGLTLVRKLMLAPKNKKFNLYALNFSPSIEPIITEVNIQAAAKIIWHRKRK